SPRGPGGPDGAALARRRLGHVVPGVGNSAGAGDRQLPAANGEPVRPRTRPQEAGLVHCGTDLRRIGSPDRIRGLGEGTGEQLPIDDVRGVLLLEGLSDEQLGDLIAAGDEVRFGSGDVLFREGEAADFWWVLLAGRVELLRRTRWEETVAGVMDRPGVWAG